MYASMGVERYSTEQHVCASVDSVFVKRNTSWTQASVAFDFTKAIRQVTYVPVRVAPSRNQDDGDEEPNTRPLRDTTRDGEERAVPCSHDR